MMVRVSFPLVKKNTRSDSLIGSGSGCYHETRAMQAQHQARRQLPDPLQPRVPGRGQRHTGPTAPRQGSHR